MSIDDMRALLGLDPSVPDAEVVELYAAYLAGSADPPPAYTRMSLADFVALHPEFSTLNQVQYDGYAAKAERRVGAEYGDERQDATELLTAHLLASNAIGMAAGVDVLAATGATSFKSGTFSATISDAFVSRRVLGGYGATSYGQQFAEIQRRLFGGPFLMGYVGHPCA